MTTREENSAALALAAAHATAIREGHTITSLRDLLCEGGCDALAFRGGLCLKCDAEILAHYIETAPAHSAMTDDTAADDATRFHYGDPEGEVFLAGLRA